MDAIGELLNTKIEFITVGVMDDKQFFLVVASDKVFFIGDKFEKVESQIDFKSIKGIIVSTKNHYLFQIHTETVVTLFALNRYLFIQSIRNSWKTDYIYKNFQFRDIPLYKKDFNQHTSIKLPVTPNTAYILGHERRIKLKGYSFAIPLQFTIGFQDGVFHHEASQNCKIAIQVADELPINLLPQIGERASLQYYAENFLSTLMSGQPKQMSDDSESDVQSQSSNYSEKDFSSKVADESLNFWLIRSSKYNKRFDLMNDKSEWHGWEIHARTSHQDIFIILLRRIFLPPMIDTDYYDPHEKIEMNDDELLLQTIQFNVEEQNHFSFLRGIADSAVALDYIEQKDYILFMQMKANALLLDKDSLDFIRRKFNIYSQYVVYGIKYLDCLLKQLEHSHEKEKYEILVQELDSRYKEVKSRFVDFLPDSILNEQHPTELFQLFEITSFVKDKYGNELERKVIWQQKLSKFLGICIDGFLLGNQFQLKDIINLTRQKVNSDIKKNLYELLDYLLFITPEQQVKEFRVGSIIKHLEELPYQKLSYNEDVMKCLIDNNFLSNELLLTDRQNLYSAIIIYVLQSPNLEMQLSVIRHIINFNAQIKQTTGLNEQMVQAFKPISLQLLQIFSQNNRSLSTLACAALFNLCTNSREFKYLIVANDGADHLVKKLNNKDNYLLHLTLKLIYSTMSITQNVERLQSSHLTDYLYSILEPPSIRGFQYDVNILTMTCQIMNICLMTEQDPKSSDHLLALLYNIYKDVADQYFLEFEESAMLKSEVLYLLTKLTQKSQEVKRKINQEIVPFLLKQMGKPKYLSKQIEEKIVMLLCSLLKENREWSLLWLDIQPKLLEILGGYHQQDIQSSNYLLTQIESFKEEMRDNNQATSPIFKY